MPDPLHAAASRRDFLGWTTATILANPVAAAASAAGASPADLPDLTISEVRVYVTKVGQLAGIVTSSGIEGNYTLRRRYWHPDWKKIIYGNSDAYLDRIVAAGFDGVYLDKIDVFEYFEK